MFLPYPPKHFRYLFFSCLYCYFCFAFLKTSWPYAMPNKPFNRELRWRLLLFCFFFHSKVLRLYVYICVKRVGSKHFSVPFIGRTNRLLDNWLVSRPDLILSQSIFVATVSTAPCGQQLLREFLEGLLLLLQWKAFAKKWVRLDDNKVFQLPPFLVNICLIIFNSHISNLNTSNWCENWSFASVFDEFRCGFLFRQTG